LKKFLPKVVDSSAASVYFDSKSELEVVEPMPSKPEKNMIQLAKDVHFLTAPVRLIWHLVIIFILLFLSPLIVSAVIFGLIMNEHFGLTIRNWLLSLGWFPPIWAHHFGNPLTADDIWVLKIILGVFGPFAFMFWFAIVTRWREVRRTGSREGVLWANVRGLLGLAMSFGGMFASLPYCFHHNIEGQASLLVMALGIMSPALIWCLFGLLSAWNRI
jgi:hypothetical protein